MKAHLLPLLLTVVALHAAVPAKDDAALAKLLDIPNGTQFTGAFARYLLELPPADLPAFRANLTVGLLEKKLPRRHAWNALGLTDTRWAETDAAGFIAACENGLKEVPPVGLRHALLRLAETDPDAAVRVWRDLKLDKDRNYHTVGLLGSLAAKDPQRAIALFKELPPPHHFSEPVAEAMIRAWLETGIDVAWQRLNELPPPPEHLPHQRRVLVCATAARQDPAKAVGLLETVAAANERAAIQAGLFYHLSRDEAPLALDLACRINTAAAWQSFASRARFGTDENTLRQLLAVLPPKMLERSLTAFFTADDPVAPAFSNARMLSLLPDAALRRTMIVAIAEVGEARMRPLPIAVVDAAAAIGPGVLDPPTPEPVAKKLLAGMLARNPLALLPWMLQLSEAEWRERSSRICFDWPISRLAEDAVTLLAGKPPRERELGGILAERWLSADPMAAFPVLLDQLPDLVRIVGAVPGAADQSGLMNELAREVARAGGAQAPEIVKLAGTESVIAALNQYLTNRLPPAARTLTWDDAVEMDLKTGKGGSLGIATIRRLAAVDPRAALATLIRTGESALQPEFLQPVLRRLAPEDPPAAFEAALRLPPEFGRPLMATIIGEWLRFDPRAACAATAKLPPFPRQEALLTNTVGSWVQMEPAAALLWIESLPPGRQRADCMATAIGHLRDDQPQRAAELFLANVKLLTDHIHSRGADLATGIAQHLADLQYRSACEFLEKAGIHGSDLPVGQHWQTHLQHWFEADPESAASYLKSRINTPVVRDFVREFDKTLPSRYLTEIAPLLPADPKAAAATPLQPPAVSHDGTLADLLLLKPAERAARLARFIDRGDPVPDSFLEDIVPPGVNRSNSDLRGQVIAALAAARPSDALLAAVRLPVATADPLVRRILAMFPDPQAATAAIDAIPEPAAAQRVRAWLACLPLGKPGAKAP